MQFNLNNHSLCSGSYDDCHIRRLDNKIILKHSCNFIGILQKHFLENLLETLKRHMLITLFWNFPKIIIDLTGTPMKFPWTNIQTWLTQFGAIHFNIPTWSNSSSYKKNLENSEILKRHLDFLETLSKHS